MQESVIMEELWKNGRSAESGHLLHHVLLVAENTKYTSGKN